MRVDFPGSPAFGEAVLRDEAPLDPVGGVALAVGFVPLHAVEGRFDGGGGVAAEMGELGVQAGHGGEVSAMRHARPVQARTCDYRIFGTS